MTHEQERVRRLVDAMHASASALDAFARACRSAAFAIEQFAKADEEYDGTDGD